MKRFIPLILATLVATQAYANPTLANPFKSVKLQTPPAAPTPPSPPWTTTTNPTTNPVVYQGMPVIAYFNGYIGKAGYLDVLTTAGNIGTTPMPEQTVFWYTTAMVNLSCQLFDTQAHAMAAYAFKTGGDGMICVSWPNPAFM